MFKCFRVKSVTESLPTPLIVNVIHKLEMISVDIKKNLKIFVEH